MYTTIARWTIEHDPDATRQCYARIPDEYACNCQSCENYLALRKGDLPRELWNLLGSLAIPFRKPAEVRLPQTGTGESVRYGVWYHFVGRIVAGADCWKPTSETGYMYDGEDIAPGVSFGFSSNLALVNEAFCGRPTVQLDFQLEVPWVLDTLSHPFFDAFNPAFANRNPDS